MCLAIPAKIESFENGIARCRVGNGDTFLQTSTMLLEREPRVGEYLIVHAGFALRILDVKEAEESLALLHKMSDAFHLAEHGYNEQKIEDDDLSYPR